MSKPKGDGFSARSWLENDGDDATQEDAASRGVFHSGDLEIRLSLSGHQIVQLRGKKGPGRVDEACRTADLVILLGRARGPASCPVLDERAFRRSGSLAIWPEEEGLRLVSASAVAGDRLWNPRPPEPQGIQGGVKMVLAGQ